MGMQTDVLASKVATSAGDLLDQNSLVIGRARVKAIYIVPNAAAGEVVFKDGGSGGPVKITVNTILLSVNHNSQEKHDRFRYHHYNV